jgi:hypothetical protein
VNARFEVVHGNPGDEELAVVISLLTAAAAAGSGPEHVAVPSTWARPAMRVTHSVGPGAWWRSGLPQP